MASFNTGDYHYDKQTLLSEHELLLARTQNNAIDSSIQTIELQSSKLIELNNLKAIKISDLIPGNSYTNKLIYSTQITPIAVAEVICFIIEDEYGNVCRVSVPGIVDTVHLVTGVKLAFSNPIYKMAFDGRYSLIVHNTSSMSLLQFGSPVKPSTSEQILNSPNKASVFPLYNPIQFTPNFFNANVRQGLREGPNIGSSLATTNPVRSIAGINQFSELNISPISPGTFDKEFLANPIKPTKKSEKQQQQQQQQQQPQQPQPHNPFQMSSKEIPELYNSDIPSTDGYELIQKGNTLFKEGRYLQAIVQYTCAIKTNNKDAAFYQNRAFCYSKMNEFESALFDFVKANLLEPENAKIQYLIALTWSKLGNHKLCLDLLDRIKPKDNVDSQSVDNLMKEARLFVEDMNGKFDFNKIRQNYLGRIPNEIGDYIGPIKILHTLTGRRGVFTTRRVKKGENLCVVKASEFMRADRLFCGCDSCSMKRMNFSIQELDSHRRLILNAKQSKLITVRLASLCDKSIKNVNIELYSGCGFELAKNFDTSLYPLETLQSLIEKNLYLHFDHHNLSPQPVINAIVYGIWLLPSFINHSCIPNAVRIYIGDVCTVRAITDIPTGEEVFTSYLPLKLYPNALDRSKLIGYTCVCRLCKFEEQSQFTEAYRELISTYNHLYTSVNPNECIMLQFLTKTQILSQNEKEKLSREKWLEIKTKLIKIAPKLLFDGKNEYISVCFRSSIFILWRVSHSIPDSLDLALEVQSYFTPLDPQTYVMFWNTFYQIVVESNNLKDARFKHVEKNHSETKKLFS